MKTDFKSIIRHYIPEGKSPLDYSDTLIQIRVDVPVRVITIVITLLAVWKHFLYSLCPMVLVTGLPCPACGMTRAGVLLLKGRFADAFAVQPFIYVIGGFAAALAVSRFLLHKKSMKWAKWTMAVIILCMVIFYIYRMIRYFPDKAPMTYYPYNLIYYLRVLFHLA